MSLNREGATCGAHNYQSFRNTLFFYINQLYLSVAHKFIASWSTSGVILVLFSNFNGVDWF